MTEQLYRSVKASERLPDEYGAVNWQDAETNLSISAGGAYHAINSGAKDKVQWLEPIPSLNAGSLEEAAKEYGNKYTDFDAFDHKDHQLAGRLKAAFLAGAAYVKGGEEIDVQKIRDVLVNAGQLINSVKVEWEAENCWSEWDQSVSDSIVELLRSTPSRPSLDIDKVVEQLREANPYDHRNEDQAKFYQCDGWNEAVNKLQELLNAPSQSPQTPRTARFHPDELDTEGEHPSDKEPEGIDPQEGLWDDLIADFNELDCMEENDWEWNRKILMGKFHITRK